jgi:integrase
LPELREKEKQIAKDLDDNILTDTAIKKMTLNTLFERYMQTRRFYSSTKINYENMWDIHVKNELGNIKVVQLRPSHIKTFYNKMSEQGYANNTIKYIHTLLYPALELAVDDDIIRKNPAKNTLSGDYGEAPKEKDILTMEQQEKLFAFVCGSPVYNVYIPMLTVMLELGLRCGELIGLTWSDIDMEKKEVSVNHQLIYKDFGDGYKFHINNPKTKAGNRIIPMSQAVQRAFTEQKKINFMLGRHSIEEIEGCSDFIFLAKTGRPLMPSAVNNVLYNIIDAYNKAESGKAEKERRTPALLPKISSHSLRHTACTNMAKHGMNIKILQYIMGHAHSDVTMDVYNHIAGVEDVKEEIIKYEKAVNI